MPQPQEFVITPQTTVAASRVFVETQMYKQGGVICPTCDQKCVVKYYRLNAETVKSLQKLRMKHTAKPPGHLVSVKEWGATGPDSFHRNLLSWYEFAFSGGGKKHFNRSGMWGLTEKGLAFLNGEIDVPEHVLVFNNTMLGVAATNISVAQAKLVPYSPGGSYSVPGGPEVVPEAGLFSQWG